MANARNTLLSESERNNLAEIEAQKTQKTQREAIANKLFEIATQPSFESHTLTDRAKYPADDVMRIIRESVSGVTDKGWSYDRAVGEITVKLDMLSKAAPLFTSENRSNGSHNSNSAPTYEFSAADPVGKIRAEMDEAGDRYLSSTPEGCDYINKVQSLEARKDPFKTPSSVVKEIMKKADNATGKVLVLASEAIKTRSRRPNHDLADALCATGMYQAKEAYINGSADLARQALLADQIFRRTFRGADYLDLVEAMAGSSMLNANDQAAGFFLQAGEELRFRLLEFIRSASDGDLIVRNPGVDQLSSSKHRQRFDSVSLREMAHEYIWETFRINALKNSLGIDLLAEVAEDIAAMFRDRMSKLALSNVDNTGRQYLSSDIAAEVPVSANLVSGATITIDGVSVTYPSTKEDGSAVDYPVDKIIRLRMDQTSATGTSVIPRLLVEPEFYKKAGDGSAIDTAAYLNDWAVAISGTGLNVGKVVNDQIVPAYFGQVPDCAFDVNRCVLLCAASAGISSGMLSTVTIKYSYCNLVDNGGNVVLLDFTLGSESEEDHINNILNTLSTYASYVAQKRSVRPNFVAGSLLVIELLARAKRWQANFNTIGSSLVETYEDVHWKGKLSGGPKTMGNGWLSLRWRWRTNYGYDRNE